MATRIMRIVGTASLGLLVAASAQAQGRNHGKDNGRDRAVVVRRDNNRTRNVIVRRDDNRPRTVIVQRNDNRPRNVIIRREDNRPRNVIIRRDNDRFDRDYRYVRGIPPGLMNKPGHMPPGQYKKRYRAYYGADVLSDIMRRRHYRVVRIVPAGEARYVYYQPYYGPNYYGDEQWILVRPGSDRLYFDNAPASILQAVLAQLY